MTQNTILTDRSALALHRARAKARPETFLHSEVAHEIEERLSEINKSFTKPLLVGHVSEPLREIFPQAPKVADDSVLSVERGQHDLVVHAFGLHWADDPVGQIIQSIRALEPDGLFLGVLFGGETLNELRDALTQAEAEMRGGLSPRIAPFGELRDLGALLQRSGAALPVADSQTFTVRYPSLSRLVLDLRGMGETNALAARDKTFPPREMFARCEAIYRDRYADEDGYLRATFEIVFLTGWAPAPTQQKPLRPGSAVARLSDALGTTERKPGQSDAAD